MGSAPANRQAGTALLAHALSIPKPHYGNQWNQQWVTAGFTTHSIAMPNTIAGRTALLKSFAQVFTDNATWEVSTADVTVTAALSSGRTSPRPTRPTT